MQKDTAAAATITAATAAASAISYLLLAATTTSKAEELKKQRFYSSMRDVSGTHIGTHIGADADTDAGTNSAEEKEKEEMEEEECGKTVASTETSKKSIRTTVSAETGYTDEGDDAVYDMVDGREIFGSRSMYSHSDVEDDSDSDISYDYDHDDNSRKSLRSSLQFPDDQNSNVSSMKGLVFDAETHEVGLDPDYHPLNSNHNCVYLDYNGTTPIDRRVFASMIPYLTIHFGNPSSSHAYGTAPKKAISDARRSIMELLLPNTFQDVEDGVLDESIIFTGCGTEADNMAIYLALNSTPTPTSLGSKPMSMSMSMSSLNKRRSSSYNKNNKKHIVTTNVEHPAITEYLKVLEAKGEIDVTYVPVNSEGVVSARKVIQAITKETVLVTIMLANNESGALQPVQDIAPYCRQRGILFHTDAAQAVGKVSIALDAKGISSDVDMVTIVGHKFGAPKGIACLYVRPGCLAERGRKEPRSYGYGSSGTLLLGGGQEGGRRAGTENTPYIVGMGCAADILNAKTSKKKHRRWRKNASKMRSIRSRLLFKFKEAFQDIDPDIVRENGPKDPTKRLPNTLSIGFKNVHSGELLNKIQSTVACSAGSACHASGGKVSGVLLAMKVPMEYARGTLRLSVGPSTTIDDVDKAAQIIIDEIKRQLKIEESEQQPSLEIGKET